MQRRWLYSDTQQHKQNKHPGKYPETQYIKTDDSIANDQKIEDYRKWGWNWG